MNAKNVPGFTDEVVDTFIRKVQGDLTLIDDVAEAYMNPTSAQVLMQAGSSKVAKLPENIAFVNPAVNAAGADGMVKLLEFMKEQREADEKREEKKRQAEEEREEKKRQADKEERQEREKFMAKLVAEQRETDEKREQKQREADEKREQKQREKDKEMAEQQNKRDDKQNTFLLAMVETLKENLDNKRAAANDGKSQAEPEEPDQKRMKLTSNMLTFDELKQEAKNWLYKNIGKFIKPVQSTKNQDYRSFTLLNLQKALHKHSTFNSLCDGRIVRCMCLHKCIEHVYPDMIFKHIKQADASVRFQSVDLSLNTKALAKIQ